MQKIATITTHKNQSVADFAYWQTKTPQERLAAIEFLRQQYIKFKFGDVPPRFCRVFTIKNKKATGRKKDEADVEDLENNQLYI
ncbi:MAG: hypothetical protein RI894_1604 [Bacteroidota bacterium]